MEIWVEVKKLQGKTLKTLDRNNPFDIVDVGARKLIVKPHVRGIERGIRRQAIEGAFKELVMRGEITRADIRCRHSNFNPAYVAAILASLPNVTFSLKPIRLYYGVEGP